MAKTKAHGDTRSHRWRLECDSIRRSLQFSESLLQADIGHSFVSEDEVKLTPQEVNDIDSLDDFEIQLYIWDAAYSPSQEIMKGQSIFLLKRISFRIKEK
jgi:hypothetical protein